MRFHLIGTADSLIEHLTNILFRIQNNLIHKWAEKKIQRQRLVQNIPETTTEFETSLNYLFFYQLPLLQIDFSSTIVILTDLRREPGITLCLQQPGQEATLGPYTFRFIKPMF